MQEVSAFLDLLFGLSSEPRNLTAVQLSLRGLVILFAALVLVRLGAKRALARKTPFDMVLIVIVGSLLSRSINGNGPLFGTIICAFVLVLVHRLLAVLAYAWHPLGAAMKGKAVAVVENGRYIAKTLRRNQITTHDVEEDLRLKGKTDDIANVRIARVERSGDISFLYKSDN